MAKTLVLDANILVRAVLGRRVLTILESNAAQAHFLAPQIAFADARTHLPDILVQRGLPPEAATLLVNNALVRLQGIVTPVPQEVYAEGEAEARKRLVGRDEADWPFLALALILGCPIWTEDRDFFGSGVATWTTDRVELYLGAE